MKKLSGQEVLYRELAQEEYEGYGSEAYAAVFMLPGEEEKAEELVKNGNIESYVRIS